MSVGKKSWYLHLSVMKMKNYDLKRLKEINYHNFIGYACGHPSIEIWDGLRAGVVGWGVVVGLVRRPIGLMSSPTTTMCNNSCKRCGSILVSIRERDI